MITATCNSASCPVQTFTVTEGQAFACPVCKSSGFMGFAPAAAVEPAPAVTGFGHAVAFANRMNEKFGRGYYTFTATKGRKYHRIVQEHAGAAGRSVHAFVDNDGQVYKADGWKAPAKGVRFTTVAAAVEAADEHGSYLYMK